MGLCRSFLAAAFLIAFSAPRANAIIVSGTNPNVSPWLSSLGGVGFFSDNDASCSASFFEPTLDYLITAAHCLNGFDPTYASYVQLTTGAVSYVSAVYVDPGYSSSNVQVDDIAIIQLATPAAAGTPYYPIYTGASPVGDSFILAGYGDAGTGTAGDESGSNPADSYTAKTLRQGNNLYSFNSAGSQGFAASDGTDLFYDFVGPGNSGNAFRTLDQNGYSLPDPNGYTAVSNEASIAGGDSGGPSLIDVNGQLEIAGVHSFTDCIYTSCGTNGDGYGTISADTDVSLFTGFIDSTIGVSSAPEPGTFGAFGIGLSAFVLWYRRRSKSRTEL